MIAAAVILSSCGTAAHQASSDSVQRFQDGIYSNVPDFITKEEKEVRKVETEALVEETRNSQIYLFGDRKDTVMIPENMSAVIKYDQKLGGTTVTVGENPYDWRYDLENNYGYYYGPYSIGSSWYWNRYYNRWYWNSWSYTPWRFYGWYDPMYTYGWYDPWYYGGWYDPWYYGWGHNPWYGYHHHYCGWYGGWDPYCHHHGHHHGHGGHEGPGKWHGLRAQTGSDRVFTSTSTTTRGGFSRSSLTRTVTESNESSTRTISASRTAGANRVPSVSGNTGTAGTANIQKRAISKVTSGIRERQTATSRPSTDNLNKGTFTAGRQMTGKTSATTVSRPVNHRKPTVTTHTSGTHSGPATGNSAGQSYSRNPYSGRTGAATDKKESGQSYNRTPSDSYNRSSSSSYNRSSSPSYNRSSSPSYNRSSSPSYNRSGSSSGFSRGGSSSGGSFSRSGGSAGPRR